MSKYPDKMGRIMSPEDQLDKWVAGFSVHNGAERGTGECCPDFSCCCEGIDTPIAARQAFKDAPEEKRFGMLGMFLSGAVAEELPETVVHVAGDVLDS